MKVKTKIALISVVLLILIVGVVVFGIVLANKNNEQTKKQEQLQEQMQSYIDSMKKEQALTADDFQVGGLSTTTGKLDSDNNYAFMTINYYNLEGASIEFAGKDTTSTYRVFFYTAEKTYLGSTKALKSDFVLEDNTFEGIESAMYFRVMIDTDETKATMANAEKLLAPITITIKK